MNKIIFGIAMTLAILAAFTAPAIAGPNTMYFTNYSGDTSPDGISYVELWLNITDPTGDINPDYAFKGADINITIDTDVGEITNGNQIDGDPWDLYWNCNLILHEGVWMTIGSTVSPPPPMGLDPGLYPVANFTIKAINPGVMDLHFSHDAPRWCDLYDSGGNPYPNQTWEDGTFTCGGAQTFTKSLPAGWNLISLPLTPTDNSTSTVLSTVMYNDVKQYKAVTKQFEDAAMMDPGIGYFVYVTSASTWEYTGTPESSMTIQLKSGLNMIGVPNCGMSVSTAMGLTDYRYVARWNAISQSYEVYNPNAPVEFHGFNTIEVGEGYFVSALSDGPLMISCP